jgi:peroxiredoxin
VLLDLGNGVARDYGLVFRVHDDVREIYRESFGVDLVRFNGDESWELPIPATFVIDAGGVIAYAEADPDYTKRPEPAELLEAIP